MATAAVIAPTPAVAAAPVVAVAVASPPAARSAAVSASASAKHTTKHVASAVPPVVATLHTLAAEQAAAVTTTKSAPKLSVYFGQSAFGGRVVDTSRATAADEGRKVPDLPAPRHVTNPVTGSLAGGRYSGVGTPGAVGTVTPRATPIGAGGGAGGAGSRIYLGPPALRSAAPGAGVGGAGSGLGLMNTRFGPATAARFGGSTVIGGGSVRASGGAFQLGAATAEMSAQPTTAQMFYGSGPLARSMFGGAGAGSGGARTADDMIPRGGGGASANSSAGDVAFGGARPLGGSTAAAPRLHRPTSIPVDLRGFANPMEASWANHAAASKTAAAAEAAKQKLHATLAAGATSTASATGAGTGTGTGAPPAPGPAAPAAAATNSTASASATARATATAAAPVAASVESVSFLDFL